MKTKVVAPFDYSPKMKVGQEVEIDKLMRRVDCESGFMARVVGIWKEPRWFDLGWFIPQLKSAQPNMQVNAVEACVKCGCGRHNHPDWLCNANYYKDTPQLEFIDDVYVLMKDGDCLTPEKLVADIVDMLGKYLFAQHSVERTAPHVDVPLEDVNSAHYRFVRK
uniref:Uncharacterized protein n=1 Tax=viral metagenome TaxID=1070528 RepID=A0A6M3LUW1_9ZZZZ